MNFRSPVFPCRSVCSEVCFEKTERHNSVVCSFDLSSARITACDIHEWIFACSEDSGAQSTNDPDRWRQATCFHHICVLYYAIRRAKRNITIHQMNCRLKISPLQSWAPSAKESLNCRRRCPMTHLGQRSYRSAILWIFRPSGGLKLVDIQWTTGFVRWRWF